MSTEINKGVLVQSMSALSEGKVYLLSREKATEYTTIPGYETYVKDNGFEHDIGYAKNGSIDNGIVIFPSVGNLVGKRLYIIGPYVNSAKTVTTVTLSHNENGPPTDVIALPIIGMDNDSENILTYVDVIQHPDIQDSVLLIGPVKDGVTGSTNKSSSHPKGIPLKMTYVYTGNYTVVNTFEINSVGLRVLTSDESLSTKEYANSDPFIDYIPEVVDIVTVMTAVRAIDKTLNAIIPVINSLSVSIANTNANIDNLKDSTADGNVQTEQVLQQMVNNVNDARDTIDIVRQAIDIDRSRSDQHFTAVDVFQSNSLKLMTDIKNQVNSGSNNSSVTKIGKAINFIQIGTFVAVLFSLFKRADKEGKM